MSDEDEEDADAIIEEAAQQGVSPEELISGLAEDVGEDDEAAGEDEEGIEAEEEPVTEKTAALHHLAGTRRGQNIANYLKSI